MFRLTCDGEYVFEIPDADWSSGSCRPWALRSSSPILEDDFQAQQAVLDQKRAALDRSGRRLGSRRTNMPRTFIRPDHAPGRSPASRTARSGRRSAGQLLAAAIESSSRLGGKPIDRRSFRHTHLIAVIPIRIRPDGLLFESNGEVRPWADLDDLAARDGIDPPTGEGLRDVLLGMHAVPASGVAGQILRW